MTSLLLALLSWLGPWLWHAASSGIPPRWFAVTYAGDPHYAGIIEILWHLAFAASVCLAGLVCAALSLARREKWRTLAFIGCMANLWPVFISIFAASRS